jgi:hypothetical protein
LTNYYSFKERFEGFQDTPLLWNGIELHGLEQYYPQRTSQQYVVKSQQKKLRLGKWVEQFVSHQLRNDKSIKVFEENIQIKDNKITIGELDVLLIQDDMPMHVEIIYKFYLFDDTIETMNPIDKWVGPNRNDALVYKLKKLKEKQLPLLYSENTQDVLKRHNIKLGDIKQRVCFKAQLFLPLKNRSIDISPLNTDCIVGWFISFKDFDNLKEFQFYIPEKLDWLSKPTLSVTWHSYIKSQVELEQIIQNKQSPLCWLRTANDELFKCFITWW